MNHQKNRIKSIGKTVNKMGRSNNSFLWGILFASTTWSISLYLYWMLNANGKYRIIETYISSEINPSDL